MRLFAPLPIAAALLTSSALFGQAPAAGPTQVRSVEGLTEYKLANGMSVLLFPDNSSPKVTVNVTYLVGSRHEGYGESGMAHLLEHMLFKGTQKRNEIQTELTNHGADYNGSTSYDRTNYFETMAATEENLNWALEMESDRMVNSRVSRKDLDSEMTVVRNEFERGENSAPRVLAERVYATAFLWHGYGRSTIGARSDIENVPIERLQDFYHKYYQPDNAILIITGKFDAAKTLAMVQDTFGKIPAPTRKLIPTYTEEPTQDGEREVTLRRVGDSKELVVVYHSPATSHPDAAALDVLAAILGETPSGRLYKALVDSKKAVRVNAGQMDLREAGLVEFTASLLKDGDLPDVEKTLFSVIDGVVKEPPSKEEVDRAKTRLLKDFELALNNSNRIGINLSESAASGDWRLLFLYRDRLEKITQDDVARVAKLYLKTSNSTVGRFIPEDKPDRTEVPAMPVVASVLQDFKGKAAIEEGETFDPSPANIDSRTIRVTLANGLKLALLPKKTRGGAVTANLSLRFGDEKTAFGKGSIGAMTGTILMRGTQKHNRQQLQDAMDQLKARINVNGSATGAGANITTVRANLAGALRLTAEILREPSFPDTELEQIRQAQISAIERNKSEPQQIALTALNQHFFSQYPAGDPRHVSTPDESIQSAKAVTLDQVKKFYNDFYGASTGELAIVGDFDAAEVQKIAAELFGNWKSPAPYGDVIRGYKKLTAMNQMLETPDKANSFFVAGSLLDIDQNNPDYVTLTFLNRIFGGDPGSWLFHRIREKEGLSYSVQSDLRAGVKEKLGQFMALAIANPENINKVEAAFKDELNKLVTTGVTAEDVDKAKKAWLQEEQIALSSDPNVAGVLARNARYGWTMQREADELKKISAMTAAEVNAAAKKWIDPSAVSIVKAGDFKKAGLTK